MFRRNKLVFTSAGIILCIFTVIQVLRTLTSSTMLMSSSVMDNLRLVEKRFAESFDLSGAHWESFLPTSNHHKHHHKPIPIDKFNPSKKPKKRWKKINTSILNEDINRKYYKARECMRSSQRNLALRLGHSYAREFAPDFRSNPSGRNSILEPECKQGLDLIIILTTKPVSFIERMGIRYSWGRPDTILNKQLIQDKPFKFKTIFTIGRDHNNMIESIISLENERYKDILRLDYLDTYENLAKKTVLTLKWVSENCKPKFVLKTDDDCYVNLHNLAPWLKRLNPIVQYVGRKNEYMPVIRDPTHRNYVSYELFGETFYKAYCSGGGYILRGTVLKNITEKATKIAEIINEDAYMGMITNALNIEPFDDERFLPFIFDDIELKRRHMCEWSDKFLMHGVSPRRQLLMHWQKYVMVQYSVTCEV